MPLRLESYSKRYLGKDLFDCSLKAPSRRHIAGIGCVGMLRTPFSGVGGARKLATLYMMFGM